MAAQMPAAMQEALAGLLARAWSDVEYGWTLPVSSDYGPRIHPTTGLQSMHTGMDLPLPLGTPVLALWDGEIRRRDINGQGPGIINGNALHLAAGPWSIAYLHLHTFRVQVGQRVTRGEILGTVGATGRTTGPHLHLQVTLGGLLVDPAILYPSWWRA